jgi:penicillin-binding protein 2
MRNLRKRKTSHEIAPDEIFLDARNLPDFNQHQLEGAIEQPISKRVMVLVGIFFACVIIIFIARLIKLQIADGEVYFAQSEHNRLHEIVLFGDRGVVYDRHDEILAWNVQPDGDEPFSYRAYTERGGFAHVLGYVAYPKKDSSGFYWRAELAGREGVESYYNDILAGEPGMRLLETNALGDIISSGQIVPPQNGENIELSLDAGMQEVFHNGLRDMVQKFGYTGGTAAVMDIYTGELLTLTSYPEYDPELLSLGQETETIQRYFTDPNKPMLNRAISGLYTPGSIVKPFVAIAALQEGVVTPDTKIMSTGYIEIPNRYNPDNPTLFYDWRWGRYKTGHGSTDVYHAIADSVNTYFYAVGGGYRNQEGIGIRNIKAYLEKFKIGQPTGFTLGIQELTGVIPDPDWKAEQFADGTWRVGDTYNTVIGQFGFQVTPLQMLRATAAIASDGILVTPHVLKNKETNRELIQGIDKKWYAVMRTAMRQTVTDGTAQILDVPQVSFAVKSGTAQTQGNKKINAWIEGFFPYESPRYAFIVMAEGATSSQTTGSSWVVFHFMDWMRNNAPEYYVTR